MATSHRLLRTLRTLHLYLGVFTAPALLFFAFTGALQTLDLHEPSRTGDYRPPAWLVGLSHLHKKESLEVPARRAPPGAFPDATAGSRGNAASRVAARLRPAPGRHDTWPMKIFFELVALSLAISAITGVYMAGRVTRHRRRYGLILAAGVAVPVLLLLI
jgi:hypothetical protein